MLHPAPRARDAGAFDMEAPESHMAMTETDVGLRVRVPHLLNPGRSTRFAM